MTGYGWWRRRRVRRYTASSLTFDLGCFRASALAVLPATAPRKPPPLTLVVSNPHLGGAAACARPIPRIPLTPLSYSTTPAAAAAAGRRGGGGG